MNQPSSDIADILATNNLGTVGTDIFSTKLPAMPDKLIAVSTTTSREPEISSKDSTGFNNIDCPNVQVLIRVKPGQNAAGYAIADTIKTLLHGMKNFTLNGAKYISVLALSDIGELGVDEKFRPVFSINFRIERSKS